MSPKEIFDSTVFYDMTPALILPPPPARPVTPFAFAPLPTLPAIIQATTDAASMGRIEFRELAAAVDAAGTVRPGKKTA